MLRVEKRGRGANRQPTNGRDAKKARECKKNETNRTTGRTGSSKIDEGLEALHRQHSHFLACKKLILQATTSPRLIGATRETRNGILRQSEGPLTVPCILATSRVPRVWVTRRGRLMCFTSVAWGAVLRTPSSMYGYV